MNNEKFQNSLNKRQNVLPNMTLRVLKGNLVLCKSPNSTNDGASFHNSLPQTALSDS